LFGEEIVKVVIGSYMHRDFHYKEEASEIVEVTTDLLQMIEVVIEYKSRYWPNLNNAQPLWKRNVSFES
jgi:hypothetical protein